MASASGLDAGIGRANLTLFENACFGAPPADPLWTLQGGGQVVVPSRARLLVSGALDRAAGSPKRIDV